MKRDFLLVFSIFLTLTIGYFMNTATIELDTQHVRTVTVKAGDTVWDIAAAHSNSHIDIREMVHAMKVINQLDETANLEPGSQIKIPTIKIPNNKNTVDYLAQNE